MIALNLWQPDGVIAFNDTWNTPEFFVRMRNHYCIIVSMINQKRR